MQSKLEDTASDKKEIDLATLTWCVNCASQDMRPSDRNFMAKLGRVILCTEKVLFLAIPAVHLG